MSFLVYDHDSKDKFIGTAYSHDLPRVGEGFAFQGSTWRVLDVFHPTEESRGVGIHIARVSARVADITWLDYDNLFGIKS